jgi:hypothetical protein
LTVNIVKKVCNTYDLLNLLYNVYSEFASVFPEAPVVVDITNILLLAEDGVILTDKPCI